MAQPLDIIRHARLTEKAMRLAETNNELVFVVDPRATKPQIKRAIEKEFGVKVERVNTMRDPKGRKKAFVKLAKEHSALDLATKLGMI